MVRAMTGGLPKGPTPAFVLSMARDDAIECGVLVFDPYIETIPPPGISRTVDGNFNEENAARYLTYKMQSQVTPRTLREWRRLRKAPSSQSLPGGQHRWYRQADLDEFLMITMQDNETDI
jgi:hypothetical protein